MAQIELEVKVKWVIMESAIRRILRFASKNATEIYLYSIDSESINETECGITEYQRRK